MNSVISKIILLFISSLALMLFSCSDDDSSKPIPTDKPDKKNAVFTIKSTDLVGSYVFHKELHDENKLVLKVNVTKIGSYTISFNHKNKNKEGEVGFVFGEKKGTFSKIGAQELIIKGGGTPIKIGNFSFELINGLDENKVLKKIVLEVKEPAKNGILLFNFDGRKTKVEGDYKVGESLTGSTNYVELTLEVFRAGKYEFKVDGGSGVSFSTASGELKKVNETKKIKLYASGTPIEAGEKEFTISQVGSDFKTKFKITIDKKDDPLPTSTLFQYLEKAVVNGKYITGEKLTDNHYISVKVDVKRKGKYSIEAISGTWGQLYTGITFKHEGEFLTEGVQIIKIIGKGTIGCR